MQKRLSPLPLLSYRGDAPARCAASWAQPLCLAAALAWAFEQPVVAAPRVEYAPQSGVQIERMPQAGVQWPSGQSTSRVSPAPSQPMEPATRVPAKAQAAPASRSARRSGPRTPLRRPHPVQRKQPLPSAPEQHAPALQLALSTQLSIGMLGAAHTAAESAHIPPKAAASHPASAERPAWWQALERELQASEQGHPVNELSALVDAHADALRAQADPPLLTRIGWAYYRADDFTAALSWFQSALRKDPALRSARQGAFYTLQKLGRWEQAYDLAADDADLQSARADLAVQLALRAQDAHQPAQAVRWLQQAIALGKDGDNLRALLAWSLLQAGQPAQAASQFEALLRRHPDDAQYAQGLSLSLQRSGQDDMLALWAVKSPAVAALLRQQRARRWLDLGLARDAAVLDPQADPALSGAAQASVAAGAAVRSKSGAAGTSQLRLVQLPALQLRWANTLGSWQVHIDRTVLDAGAALVGTNVGSTLPGPSGSAARQAVGVSGQLRWRSLGPTGWQASLGSTPSGGAVASTWTGRIGWGSLAADHDWQIALRRAPVDDSVLSLTGLRDPASGRAWGRVLREGLVAGGYQSLGGGWNLGAQAVAERLRGQDVARNTHWSASLSLTRDLPIPGMRFFSLGPNVAYEHYARNLSGFTWGQGGYFSPQRFSSASLLAVFQTADARPWVLAGQVQLGWQSVQQDASACFALTPPVFPAPVCAPLAASRSSGLGSSTALQASWLLSPHWALEASGLWRTGPAYHDRGLYLSVRYFFSPRQALFGDDLPHPR